MNDREDHKLERLKEGVAAGHVLRGGALRIGSYFLVVLLSLLSTRLLADYLGPVDYGYYGTVMSITMIVLGFADGGFSSVGIREFVTSDGHQRRDLIANILGIRTSLMILGGAAAVAFVSLADYPSSVKLGMALVMFGSVFVVLQSTYILPLNAELKLGWLAVIDLLRQLALTVLIVIFVLLGTGLLTFFSVGIPVSVVLLVATVWLVRKTVLVLPNFHWRRWLPLIRETALFALATALAFAYPRLAIVFVSSLSTELETGYYAASARVIEVFLTVPVLLITAIFPVLAHAAKLAPERLRYLVDRITVTNLLLGVGVAIGLFVGPELVIAITAGDKFDPAAEVLQVQSLMLIGTFMIAGCGYLLLTLRRYRVMLIGNLFALTAVIIAALLLVPDQGARGAAIATVIAESVLAVTYLRALFGQDDHFKLPKGDLLKTVLAGVIAAVTGLLLLSVSVLFAVLVAGLLYLALVAALKVLPEEINFLFKLGRREE